MPSRSLPSRDLHETLTFYERLGFENRGAAPDEWDYLILGRGGVELHFIAAPDTDPLTTTASCTSSSLMRTHCMRSGRGRVAHDGATGSRVVAPMDTDYGMREFALVDRSGNLIRVGSQLRPD